MANSSAYEILFDPIKIGKFTAKNRFYQVPHCNGGGHRDPASVAAMRGMKAEGGWGVIFTEQCDVHHSAEPTPYIELRLWDDKDIPAITHMAQRMKSHGALAGIQLLYSGLSGSNLYSREVALAPTAFPIQTCANHPVSARAMDKQDIKDCIRWHANAARRAKEAGFDIICLYGVDGAVLDFMSSETNQRTDEYGGSLKNRSRFLRETVDAIRQTVGDDVAISLRLSLDEIDEDDGLYDGELRELIEMHRDLPDVWDFARGEWSEDSGPSRFTEEAVQQPLIEGLKALTDKPIVGVGRFTSPDVMVAQIKKGILDFIGCARPSIADPFLPNKILEGRVEDIRECIGCNVCISGDITSSPSRCTQNPSFMEEWRKDWHPENMNGKGASKNILVVGSGPSGLEASLSLARRGYDVTLAEAKTELGGRVLLEAKLPGLSAWKRVVDYRLHQLQKLPNVEIYQDSALDHQQILEFGFQHVAIATGAHWRKDGVARHHLLPPTISSKMPLFTADDIMEGRLPPKGKIIVYDDDHYYMGGVIAEKLVMANHEVILVTPQAYVSQWTINTLEQEWIHSHLLEIGVTIMLNRGLEEITRSAFLSDCIYEGDTIKLECDAVVMVTSRLPNDSLLQELQKVKEQWHDYKIDTVEAIGDALAPGPIAWATYAGHRYARDLDMVKQQDTLPFKREVPQIVGI